MENKIKEKAKLTICYETDEEPIVDASLRYKDGSIVMFKGTESYETIKYLFNYLKDNGLSSGDIDKHIQPSYLPDLYGQDDEELITPNDIDKLFPELDDELETYDLISKQQILGLFE